MSRFPFKSCCLYVTRSNLMCWLAREAERNDFLKGWTVPSSNNCKITEQSVGMVAAPAPAELISLSRLPATRDWKAAGTTGGRGKRRAQRSWARKPFFLLSRHFYSKTSLRCSTYYGAQNCLMCLFLLLMQPANRKTGYCSPRESVQYNKTCKHYLSN